MTSISLQEDVNGHGVPTGAPEPDTLVRLQKPANSSVDDMEQLSDNSPDESAGISGPALSHKAASKSNLQEQLRQSENEVARLNRKENTVLDKNTGLTANLSKLQSEYTRLQEKNIELQNKNVEAEQRNAENEDRLAELQTSHTRISELEQWNQNLWSKHEKLMYDHRELELLVSKLEKRDKESTSENEALSATHTTLKQDYITKVQNPLIDDIAEEYKEEGCSTDEAKHRAKLHYKTHFGMDIVE